VRKIATNAEKLYEVVPLAMDISDWISVQSNGEGKKIQQKGYLM
jgi:hypothetical protein